MDHLAALLDGPHARGAFLLRVILDPPWSIRVEDEAPLTVLAVVRGAASVVRDGVTQVRPGEVAVVRGPAPYVLSDRPDTARQVVIHPGAKCTALDGRPL